MSDPTCRHCDEAVAPIERLFVETRCVWCGKLCCRFCTGWRLGVEIGVCTECQQRLGEYEADQQSLFLLRMLLLATRANIDAHGWRRLTVGGASISSYPRGAPSAPVVHSPRNDGAQSSTSQNSVQFLQPVLLLPLQPSLPEGSAPFEPGFPEPEELQEDEQ